MEFLKKNKWLLLLAFVLIISLLAACGGGDEEEAPEEDDETEEGTGDDGGDDGEETQPEGPVYGGTITGAMHTAPDGQFNPIFYETTYDSNILSFTHNSLLRQNDDLEYEPNIATEWEFSEDNRSVTFKLRDDVYWHDGEQFTADDVVFTYRSIAHPDYVGAGGQRSSYAAQLVGFEEYRAGETDEFPGVVAEDDFTVTFHYKEPNVTALMHSNFTPIPEHIFADVPVAEMPEHPASQQAGEVIGTGPFQLASMIEGQEYRLEKFEDYWQGEPYLDAIVWRIVNQDIMLSLLETGEIDFIGDPSGFQPADYAMVEDMDHITIIEQRDFGYQLLGFIHNYVPEEDLEEGVFVPENYIENPRISNPQVRQAIAHAIDREALIGDGPGDGLLHGRGELMNAPIAPQFWAYDDVNPKEYDYNVDLANELLDDAGYIDVNDDGFREDPDGNEWVLTMVYPSGNEIRERSAPIIVEDLEAVGIKVDLLSPFDMSAYTGALTETKEFDLYLLGWSLGTGDPDPSGLWSADAGFNFGRWYNPEAEELRIAAVTPPDAFDQAYRTEVYSDWQVMFQEDLPALILYAQNMLFAHSNQMQGINPSVASFNRDNHLWWLLPEDN